MVIIMPAKKLFSNQFLAVDVLCAHANADQLRVLVVNHGTRLKVGVDHEAVG
jgi:hypothetical protein